MAEERRIEVSAIVVSYNTRELTPRCLRALHNNLAGKNAEVWVVDNASMDGSAQAVRDEFPDVRLITNSRNIGFGAANNQAMGQAQGRYLLLLNSDAFVEKGTTSALIDYLERHPRAAAVGPRLFNADGSLQMSCYPFPSLLRAWIDSLALARVFPYTSALGDFRSWGHDSERLVPWVIGACALVRQSAYEQLGGFDERFFLYSEETDWQKRMRQAGWEIGFTPAARVMHLGAGSRAAHGARATRHFFESQDAYYRKHFGLIGLLLFRLATLFGCTWRVIGWSVTFAMMPGLRKKAKVKLTLNSWLLIRQALNWRPTRKLGTAS